jgi:signal transduction histidine kinase
MTVYENMGFIINDTHPVGYMTRDLGFLIITTMALTFFYDRALNRYIREINYSRSQYSQVNTELTERNEEIMKINEELIRAKEKAEESDRLKTSFLANLSHEIRTPMNGIIGFSELVVSPHITEAEKTEYNNIIVNSCRQLLGVVNDIIDISKIESGIIDLNRQPVNLNDLMHEVHALHHLTARMNGIDLELYTGLEEEKSYILTDDVKLRQILNNLINNALKFTEKGSIRFGYTVSDKFLEFFVLDTGKGISEENQNTIFERFVQEDGSHSRRYGGTGLGLSIARAYVEKLGGRIWVQSRLDQGSKFFFTIPFESIHLKGKRERKADAPLSSDRIKVLIVEDIEINEILLSKMLADYNFELLTAKTGEQALAVFEKNRDLGLIFMDIKLPGMDGLEATREIRRKNKHVPVIAQTAYAFAEDRTMALAAGCSDIISKPITKAAVDEAVRKFIK